MKPIIIEMKDMSDSTEIYDSNPHPVSVGFIYLLLAMVVSAFVWMHFSKIDIVIKGTGTVVAADDIATVTNQVAGVITERRVEDGQQVQIGDILYVVSHEELISQLTNLEQQLIELKKKEEMLQAYEQWLKNGEEFPKELVLNSYYGEFLSRKQLMELERESTLQVYEGDLAIFRTKLSSNTEIINYYNDAVKKSRQLIEAIRSRENSFSSVDSYYWNAVENYLIQYQQMINQYNEKINELQKQSETAAKEIVQLEAQRGELLQVLDLNKQIEVVSVSDGDANVDVGTSIQLKLQNVETQLVNQKTIKETADSGISQYNMQMNLALNSYQTESVAAVEASILNYEQSLETYKGVQQEYLTSQNMLLEKGTDVELSSLITQEKHSVVVELEGCRQSQAQLNTQIESLEREVANATVKANIDGIVNLANDLVEGDYVGVGVQTLSIIPNTKDGSFMVKSYVENKDIAKIHEGMKVTYEIAAYPSKEYGVMSGVVTFVSADLKVNNGGSAYYVIETSINEEELCNRVGDEIVLKVGMLCETKVVIEEKSMLEVLAEKLFHIAN